MDYSALQRSGMPESSHHRNDCWLRGENIFIKPQSVHRRSMWCHSTWFTSICECGWAAGAVYDQGRLCVLWDGLTQGSGGGVLLGQSLQTGCFDEPGRAENWCFFTHFAGHEQQAEIHLMWEVQHGECHLTHRNTSAFVLWSELMTSTCVWLRAWAHRVLVVEMKMHTNRLEAIISKAVHPEQQEPSPPQMYLRSLGLSSLALAKINSNAFKI